MSRKSTVFSVLRRSISAVLANLTTVIPVVAVMGGMIAVVDLFLYEWIHAGMSRASAQDQQTGFIKVMLAWWAAMLIFEVILGPIVGAIAVYVGRSHSQGTTVTPYKALNFAINRYGRLFKWHAAAWLSIHVGMLVLVPGILFLLQYAFVDSIVCLENEKWPLSRSKKLTRGRRRRIFMVALVVLIVSQAMGFAELDALKRGLPWLMGLMAGVYLLNFTVQVAFYMFYEDRTTPTEATG